jgi:hypothetical protein
VRESVADRATAATFEYLDTVSTVDRFTAEIAHVKELALDTGRRELPPLRRSHLSVATFPLGIGMR